MYLIVSIFLVRRINNISINQEIHDTLRILNRNIMEILTKSCYELITIHTEEAQDHNLLLC